jgi:NAD(P)-dependent dehydrogenase (short-subunit alcohol dehydrogenase family)
MGNLDGKVAIVDGKVAIVTGAARGLGRAGARRVGCEGRGS